jgi:hypothetical protein
VYLYNITVLKAISIVESLLPPSDIIISVSYCFLNSGSFNCLSNPGKELLFIKCGYYKTVFQFLPVLKNKTKNAASGVILIPGIGK